MLPDQIYAQQGSRRVLGHNLFGAFHNIPTVVPKQRGSLLFTRGFVEFPPLPLPKPKPSMRARNRGGLLALAAAAALNKCSDRLCDVSFDTGHHPAR